jgi:5-methylcytosine-specific restriction endonuclease McrA
LADDEKIAIRKPPTDARFALHLPQQRGKCRWCGKPVDPATGRFLWHDDCHAEFYIIMFPDSARRAVEQRDHGVCFDCGEDWSERYVLRPSGITFTMSGDLGMDWDDPGVREQYHADRRLGFWSYSELVWVSLWHVDHKVPLWKVAHLPALKRLVFFMLGNMVTRCHRCHAIKTKEEAAERAHFKRLRAPKADRKPKPRWGSRPFPPKGSRPMKRKKP